ncbi:MAG: endonuclease [Melioribacteraceae bacterium]|nr:endonuclease [Melioribacteraceae bacterium]
MNKYFLNSFLVFMIVFNFNLNAQTVSDLFISEYVEGSSYNKYLEIFNGTGNSIDLSEYQIRLYANGSTAATITNTLSGTIANNSVVVYRNSSANIFLGATIVLSSINFNGDDAIALVKVSGDSFVDVIGKIGEQKVWTNGDASTQNKTLRRKSSIFSGDQNGSDDFDPSIEWDGYLIDNVDGLGSHGGSITLPNAPLATAALSITSSGFTANWNLSTGATSYFLDVSELFDFSTFVTGSENLDVGNVTSHAISGLNATSDYYYRVRANNSAGTSSNSNVITAHTLAVPNTEINFVSTSATKSEYAGSFDLEISISNPDAGTATTADIVLTSGDNADINNYSTQSISFLVGSNDNQTVSVTITDDSEDETLENFVFTIQNVSGGNLAAVGSNNQFTLSISDNDGSSSGYYASVLDSYVGNGLRNVLHYLIKDHIEFPYTASTTDVWDILMESDEDPNNSNNVVLLYTGRSQDKGFNDGVSDDNDAWNREHVWAKSHGDFGTEPGAGTDCHHLRPADKTVNSSRSNLDFDNGGSQHAEATECYYDSDSWEPRDAVKGDVARMILYMDVRYEGGNSEPDLVAVDNTNNSGIGATAPFHGKLSTLIQWHKDDPPDDFERNRNEVVYQYQKNRNPFIDHPEYVSKIWETDVITPEISDVNRSQLVPFEDQDLEITSIITDDGSITNVQINYTINGGFVSTQNMLNVSGDYFSGTIPSSEYANEDIVNYWITAFDNDGNPGISVSNKFMAGTASISRVKSIDADGVLLYKGISARVRGTATVSSGVLKSSNLSCYLQDSGGGINIYNSDGNIFAITENHEYSVTGEIAQYRGVTEIILSEGIDYGKVEPVAAISKSISELYASAETYEGMLVKIDNVSLISGSWPAEGSNAYELEISDAGATITMPVYVDTDIDGSTEPVWPTNMIGIFSQYDYAVPLLDSYQLIPRCRTDFEVVTDIVINEILADPDATNGDANEDGSVSTGQDEFVEIYNNSNFDVNISGWTISDEVGLRHTFPSGTIITANSCLVVFGGGTPTGDFGGALVQTASSGTLGLNNTGDIVTISDGSDLAISYTYGSEGGDNQSLTRNPDITGTFVKHSTVSAANGKLFSPGFFNNGISPLPVELVSFTANVTKNIVKLEWSTATEVNNYGFEIERSDDEETWINLDFIEGYGNSNSPKNYFYTDINNDFGIFYYRLKQIDTDGEFEYHGAVSVEVGGMTDKFILEQNFPNPFNPTTKIRFGFKTKTNAKLKVYNSIGKEVAELFNNKADARRIYEVEFNSKNLASGVYFYSIISDSRVEVKKMLLLK